jgi:tripartite-type tricarboxylate transporter receptor subunit TctC
MFRGALILFALGIVSVLPAMAQTGSFPAKPMRLVLPFPPGGSTDILARLIGQKMSESWGKPVIVDNRPGGSGAIAAEAAAKSLPDGHTVYLGTLGDIAINPSLFRKLPYDPEKDFAPVGLLAVTPLLLVTHPSLPTLSIKELIDAAKAKPGSFSFLSVGEGSTQHLAGELFKRLSGTDMVHVPYKGGAPQATALLGGQERQFGFMVMGTAIPYVHNRRLRALGISTAKRSPALPDVPTLNEAGLPGFETGPWYALFVPANTPKEVIGMLNAETARILKLADVAARLTELGFELTPSSPEELGRYVTSEIAKYRKIVQDSGIPTN